MHKETIKAVACILSALIIGDINVTVWILIVYLIDFSVALFYKIEGFNFLKEYNERFGADKLPTRTRSQK